MRERERENKKMKEIMFIFLLFYIIICYIILLKNRRGKYKYTKFYLYNHSNLHYIDCSTLFFQSLLLLFFRTQSKTIQIKQYIIDFFCFLLAFSEEKFTNSRFMTRVTTTKTRFLFFHHIHIINERDFQRRNK